MSDSKVQYHVTRDCVHLSFGGNHVSVGRGDRNFAEICDLIKEGRQDEIIEVFERKSKTLEEFVEGSGFTLENGRVVDAEGQELPPVLSQRLQELKNEGFSVNYLVQFWNNLKQNPSFRSREQLFKFLEQNGHPLTDDGHFIAYRGCTRNFRDRHTGKFDNSPGSVCEMPREQVDDDPTRTCSYGFHVAAWDYAYNWAGGDGHTLKVKVNPRDVVSVPTDYNGQKMRVCRFEVLEVCEQKLDGVVDGHVYRYTDDILEWGDIWENEGEDEYSQEDVDWVLEQACVYNARYGGNRSVLAARIEEDVEMGDYIPDGDLSLVNILEILNENEDEWLDA